MPPMHQTAASTIDPGHYERYPERVREIEAEISRRLSESDRSGLPVFFEVGLAAHLGETLVNEGERRFEAADYDGANLCRLVLDSDDPFSELDVIGLIARARHCCPSQCGSSTESQRTAPNRAEPTSGKCTSSQWTWA
jgi:hypothetical protein